MTTTSIHRPADRYADTAENKKESERTAKTTSNFLLTPRACVRARVGVRALDATSGGYFPVYGGGTPYLPAPAIFILSHILHVSSSSLPSFVSASDVAPYM